MNAENKRKKIKQKKKSSPRRTVLFFTFVLFSCLLLIVFSSIFISKDVEQFSDKQEDTMLYEEKKAITEVLPDMQESSVPQKEYVEKTLTSSSNKTQSSVPNAPKADLEVQKGALVKSSVPQVEKNIDRSQVFAESSVPQKKRGSIILVLDDGGHNISQLQPFLNLPFPLTIAILPALAYTKESASLTRKAGKEVMLHQPMQAINLSVDPGPSAILPNMTEAEIRAILQKNVSEIAPIVGMNNHEGSLITADANAMSVVLDFCRDNALLFLDSRTNVETKVSFVAKEKKMQIWERNIFLDNTPDTDDITSMFQSGLEIAEKNGSVIMIGHVWSGSHLAQILDELGKKAIQDGFVFTTLSALELNQ
ncbi:MAG TPA: divergent polysaccharide deacetylase family protein [Treponemataceae bacterium]|nr:divergent polysaccharide deacetylase family protein [Treponemataceae bacterium]